MKRSVVVGNDFTGMREPARTRSDIRINGYKTATERSDSILGVPTPNRFRVGGEGP